MSVVYETFVKEMATRFPHLRAECAPYMDENEPLPYFALGCVLNPWLETCLEIHDTTNIRKICEFLEEAATENDNRLDDLIGIEIGEWLPEVEELQLLLSHLGPETRRLCSYHIDRLPS